MFLVLGILKIITSANYNGVMYCKINSILSMHFVYERYNLHAMTLFMHLYLPIFGDYHNFFIVYLLYHIYFLFFPQGPKFILSISQKWSIHLHICIFTRLTTHYHFFNILKLDFIHSQITLKVRLGGFVYCYNGSSICLLHYTFLRCFSVNF